MPRYALLLSMGLPLLLAACGGGSTTPPDTTPPGTTPPDITPIPEPEPEPVMPGLTLSGTSNGYTGTAAGPVASMQNSLAEVATGTIAADGAFSLELPGELTDVQLSDSETYVFCEDNPVDVSAATWEADLLAPLEVQDGDVTTGELILSNGAEFTDSVALSGLKQVIPVYSVSTLSVNGDCGDLSMTTTFNMQLQPGWNYVVLELTSDDGTTGTLNTVPSLPTDVRWDFLPASSAFSASGEKALPQWRLKRK